MPDGSVKWFNVEEGSGFITCALCDPFMECGKRYDVLVADLTRGSGRQRRRRPYGAPPIQRPRRIDLGRILSRTGRPCPQRSLISRVGEEEELMTYVRLGRAAIPTSRDLVAAMRGVEAERGIAGER